MLARWTVQEVAVTMAAPQVRARRMLPVGAWRSQVARIVRDDEVGGSNPLAPTTLFEESEGRPSLASDDGRDDECANRITPSDLGQLAQG